MEELSFYKNKKVLITGGLGMLGSSVANFIVPLGAEVTLLDAKLPLYGANDFNIKDVKDKVKVIIGDIRDKELVNELIKNEDIIFDFAAQLSHSDSMNIPYTDLDINCRGHLNILEACREHNKNAKIIFSSTNMVIGDSNEEIITEETNPEPRNIYGAHKLTAEKYYLIYNKHYNMNTTVLRITNMYGTRGQMKHGKYSILNWFIKLAIDNKEIEVYGDGEQKRDFIFIDDIVKAFVKVPLYDITKGKIYNLSTGKSESLIKAINIVTKLSGSGKVKKVPWPDYYKNMKFKDNTVSNKKLMKDINWKPKIGLNEGIKKTIEFYNKNKKHYWDKQ